MDSDETKTEEHELRPGWSLRPCGKGDGEYANCVSVDHPNGCKVFMCRADAIEWLESIENPNVIIPSNELAELRLSSERRDFWRGEFLATDGKIEELRAALDEAREHIKGVLKVARGATAYGDVSPRGAMAVKSASKYLAAILASPSKCECGVTPGSPDGPPEGYMCGPCRELGAE